MAYLTFSIPISNSLTICLSRDASRNARTGNFGTLINYYRESSCVKIIIYLHISFAAKLLPDYAKRGDYAELMTLNLILDEGNYDYMIFCYFLSINIVYFIINSHRINSRYETDKNLTSYSNIVNISKRPYQYKYNTIFLNKSITHINSYIHTDKKVRKVAQTARSEQIICLQYNRTGIAGLS